MPKRLKEDLELAKNLGFCKTDRTLTFYKGKNGNTCSNLHQVMNQRMKINWPPKSVCQG